MHTTGSRPRLAVSTDGGRELLGLVLDIDATLVTCRSEKANAAPAHKHGFGCHPLPCFLDNTGETLAGLPRPGNAAANTATDHISCSMPRSPRSPKPTTTAPTSSSAPTAPDRPKPS
ncbi:transposase [Streptomyces alanosinicus]|uniref:Transposase DDE domain-containing protein n=1 Tax=Streptomyces alanosinicus TaxID=68171 RepID=A0A918YRY3_9ACTN|nr:hypothetical protein GCM10010339_81480 [Streptomyces alanosinicus]